MQSSTQSNKPELGISCALIGAKICAFSQEIDSSFQTNCLILLIQFTKSR